MYSCKIICDSLSPMDARLTTFEITFPRMVLAELNTHKMLSKNSASSRAIPTEKMFKRIEEDPFIPIHWGKNQKGMQAERDITETEKQEAISIWKSIIEAVTPRVKSLLALGVHKQITNRWLETALWHTCIISGTEWDNFFNLRDSLQAQPELKDIVHTMKEQYFKAMPLILKHNDLHLPYVTGFDKDKLIAEGYTQNQLAGISSGRCARVSVLNHDGKRDPKSDLELAFSKLLPSGHMSPFEHPAIALSKEAWREVSTRAAQRWIEERIPVGNFWGFLQWRKTLQGEHCYRGDE